MLPSLRWDRGHRLRRNCHQIRCRCHSRRFQWALLRWECPPAWVDLCPWLALEEIHEWIRQRLFLALNTTVALANGRDPTGYGYSRQYPSSGSGYVWDAQRSSAPSGYAAVRL